MIELDFDREPPALVCNGNVLLKYCFNITLYSLDMSEPRQKEAVVAIFDDYAALYGPRMNWTTNPVSGAFKPLGGRPDNYLTPGEWLMAHPRNSGYAFLYHGGKETEDASDISFMAMSKDSFHVRRKTLSSLSCRFPLADVRNGAADIPALMRRWCDLFKPRHARAGYSAGWWYNRYSMQGPIHSRLTEQLMFYPGLQFDGASECVYDEEHQTGLHDGPRCADWLIALSDPFLEKLGGLKAVTEAMHPLPVLPYEGGAVLQAGDAPGLGGDGDPESLPDYLHLGRVIEPVRAKNLHDVIYIGKADNFFGVTPAQNLTDRWCTRFSGKKTAYRAQYPGC